MLTSEDYMQMIRCYYGNTCARRSGVPYMNHITEGVEILRHRNKCSVQAIWAYMLHPIFQDDDRLDLNLRTYGEGVECPIVLGYCMEYRNVANRGLHCYQVDNPANIYLSPIADVNEMLVADKVQNRKDFLKYHLGTHPKSTELDIYFKNWLRRLEVTEAEYQSLCAVVDASR